MFRAETRALLLLAALFAWGPASAQSSALRPAGPVKINADRAEWEKGGAMVYSGNVRLESGDLRLVGNRLELRQFDSGDFEAHIDGRPAALEHAGVPGDTARPPVAAQASQLRYDSRGDTVEVLGNAVLTRGTEEVRGQSIRYDVVQRRIQAAGGEGGQVQIIIQPPPRKDAPASAPRATP